MRSELQRAVEGDLQLAQALHSLVGRRLPPAPPGLESAPAPEIEIVAAANSDRGLEAIVERHGRPSLLIFDGMYEPPLLDPWAERLAASVEALQLAIAATGRVEVKGIGSSHLGTAWMIDEGIAVTNRHVAELFTRPRNGTFDIRTDPDGQPYRVLIDFLAEADNTQSKELQVTGVLFVASDVQGESDVAFLELDPSQAPSPVPTGDDSLLTPQEFVAAIGYPAWDSRNNAADMQRIFAGTFDVKRLAPGWVKQVQPSILTHDCTTLGGSSGSMVVSLAQGAAVGLHFSGQQGIENRAVRISEVRRLLDRARGRATGSGPPASPLGDEDVEAAPVLDGRQGYVVEGFLGEGLDVPVPSPIDEPDRVLTALLQPGPDGAADFNLRYHNFSSFMHAERRMPMFTAVNVDGSALVRTKRTRDRWFTDHRIAKDAQIGAELYQDNALDKGHLVRRLDPSWGDAAAEAVLDTFHYTNCAPQHSWLNQRTWLALEDYVLESASTHGLRICVFTGPVFADGDPIYRDSFRLPQAFWKVVVAVKEGGGEGGPPALAVSAYALSQAELVANLEFAFGPFRTYQVPIRRVERWARLRFDPAIVAADAMAVDEAAALYRTVDGPADLRL